MFQQLNKKVLGILVRILYVKQHYKSRLHQCTYGQVTIIIDGVLSALFAEKRMIMKIHIIINPSPEEEKLFRQNQFTERYTNY